MALFNRILTTTCGAHINEESDMYTSGVPVADSSILLPPPASASATMRVSAADLTANTATSLFLVEHGLRRSVPDKATLMALGFEMSDVEGASTEQLKDLPLGRPFLSRKDGMLYRYWGMSMLLLSFWRTQILSVFLFSSLSKYHMLWLSGVCMCVVGGGCVCV